MSLYIDIHTHHAPKKGDVLAIKNKHQSFEHNNPLFYYSGGLHPTLQSVSNLEGDLIVLKNHLLKEHFLAVGECGLDRLSDMPLQIQEKLFIHQIQLANELAKPLIIHCVRAHREVFKLLRDFQVNVPVIFHGFNNKYELAKSVLDQGYYLSFGKSIYNPGIQTTFTKLPADKIFMETDDGEMDIQTIYHYACQLRNISLSDWQLQIRQNFSDIFPNLPS